MGSFGYGICLSRPEGKHSRGQRNATKAVSLARFELKEAKPEWFEWTGYLEKGFEPEVRLERQWRPPSVWFDCS